MAAVVKTTISEKDTLIKELDICIYNLTSKTNCVRWFSFLFVGFYQDIFFFFSVQFLQEYIYRFGK